MSVKFKDIQIVIRYEEDGKTKKVAVGGDLLDLNLSQSIVGFDKRGHPLPAGRRKVSILLHAMTKTSKFERDVRTAVKLQRARK